MIGSRGGRSPKWRRGGGPAWAASSRALGIAITVASTIALGGCATGTAMLARPAIETLPFGSPLRVATLADPDAWLRHHMMFGAPDQALTLLTARRSAVSDELLRAMQQALVLRQSGEFVESNRLLEWAEIEAERRAVRSVTRTAGSFLVNDRVLGYSPSPSELSMLSYYRMMNHLALDDLAGAAVEARRLTAQLSRGDRGAVRGCRSDAVLQYLAGLTFEAAGELNDALIALRWAEQGFRACGPEAEIRPPPGFGADLYRLARRVGVDEVADSARARYPGAESAYAPGVGEVIVIVERGFVAHLTEEVLEVALVVEDVDGLKEDDTEGIAGVAAAITAELTLGYRERGVWGSSAHPARYGSRRNTDIDDVYFLKLAWPGIRRDPVPASSIRLLIGGDSIPLVRVADLSTVAADELESRRLGMLTRLVGRGILKYIVTREVERKAEEEGGKLLGTITGLLTNAAAAELERAETRSWSLLPDEISIVRLTLPAGTHQLGVQSVGAVGDVEGNALLEAVEVQAGRTKVVHRRMWGDDLSVLTRN